MKYRWLAAALCALSAFSVSAQTEVSLSCAEGSASVALVPVVQAVYKELGISAKVTMLPAERALVGANGGTYDGDVARADGTIAAYPNLMMTAEVISSLDIVPWVVKDSPIKLGSAQDLKSYKVAYIRGLKLAEKICADAGITAEVVPDFETLSKMLAGGRVDVALTAKAGNPDLLKTAKSLPLVLGSSKFHHVLNKKNEALASRFDAVLKAMKADGRYEKLLKK